MKRFNIDLLHILTDWSLFSSHPLRLYSQQRRQFSFIFIHSSAAFMHLRWWLRPRHQARCWWRWSAWQSQKDCADQSDACGSSSESDPRSWILHHRGFFWWWCAESAEVKDIRVEPGAKENSTNMILPKQVPFWAPNWPTGILGSFTAN